MGYLHLQLYIEAKDIILERNVIDNNAVVINEDFVLKPKQTYDIYVLRPLEIKGGDVYVSFTYYSARKKGKMKYYKKGSDYKVTYEYKCSDKEWSFIRIEETGF